MACGGIYVLLHLFFTLMLCEIIIYIICVLTTTLSKTFFFKYVSNITFYYSRLFFSTLWILIYSLRGGGWLRRTCLGEYLEQRESNKYEDEKQRFSPLHSNILLYCLFSNKKLFFIKARETKLPTILKTETWVNHSFETESNILENKY